MSTGKLSALLYHARIQFIFPKSPHPNISLQILVLSRQRSVDWATKEVIHSKIPRVIKK